MGLSSLGRAAVTKNHSLGVLSNRDLFSQCSTGWKAKINLLAGLVSSQGSLIALSMAPFSVSSHGLLLVPGLLLISFP